METSKTRSKFRRAGKGIRIKPRGRFSAALKKAVESKGMTGSDLAQAANSTYENIRKLLGGKSYPSRNLLEKLARIFDEDVEQWACLVEWDRVMKEYGCIPSSLRPSEAIIPFARIVPKLSVESQAILLATAKTMLFGHFAKD